MDYLFEGRHINIILVLSFIFKRGFKYFFIRVDIFTAHQKYSHNMHSIPFLIPFFLCRFLFQPVFPLDPKLIKFIKLNKGFFTRLFKLHITCINLWSFHYQIFLKGYHQLCLMLSSMRNKTNLIQKSNVPQILKKLEPRCEAFLILLIVQPIKRQNLTDVITDQILQFDVLLISTAKETFFTKFYKFRRQKQTQECANTPVGLVEIAELELVLIFYNIEVNLFLHIDRVSSVVVVCNEMSFINLQYGPNILHLISIFQYNEEINITVQLFFRQGNIGFNDLTDRLKQASYLRHYGSILCRRQFLSVFKSIASHSSWIVARVQQYLLTFSFSFIR